MYGLPGGLGVESNSHGPKKKGRLASSRGVWSVASGGGRDRANQNLDRSGRSKEIRLIVGMVGRTFGQAKKGIEGRGKHSDASI